MPDDWWTDDDQLVAVLADALDEARAVPPEFVEAGKAAYVWRTIDAELAALTYDSVADAELAGTLRADSATLRALTFASADLTIELEVTADALLGQVVPVEAGRVTAYAGPAADTLDRVEVGTAVIDELGFFVLRPVPAGSFRLLCRTASGITALTGWIHP
ncbi:hypothetical protein FB561_0183 [Kribbella amoyensis]|uniref:Uncharacterized protein n=1 Tax=Kribbella amoyensis TaxID=996641 RepID=A0A561BJS0_9ACTN|nr:hypothetical protein [Kribbella amoyensis]TWD79128.1 hypothetical protein FB561_0183 [Kribbella amoyensis]